MITTPHHPVYCHWWKKWWSVYTPHLFIDLLAIQVIERGCLDLAVSISPILFFSLFWMHHVVHIIKWSPHQILIGRPSHRWNHLENKFTQYYRRLRKLSTTRCTLIWDLVLIFRKTSAAPQPALRVIREQRTVGCATVLCKGKDVCCNFHP